MKSKFARTGLRVAFRSSAIAPGPVTTWRPNGDGVLAVVPAAALAAPSTKVAPSHTELNRPLAVQFAAEDARLELLMEAAK